MGSARFEIGGVRLDQVQSMKYLGVIQSSDGSLDSEIEYRIGGVARVAGSLAEVVLRNK